MDLKKRFKRLSYLLPKIKGIAVGLSQTLYRASREFLAHPGEPGLEVRKIPVRQLGLRTGQIVIVRRG